MLNNLNGKAEINWWKNLENKMLPKEKSTLSHFLSYRVGLV